MKHYRRPHAAGTDKRRMTVKSLALTVVALVLVVILGVMATSAWVETISTYRIYTSNSEQPNLPAVQTGTIMNAANHKATVTAGNATAIDLSKMIHESGEFHLAPASSAVGTDIFFNSARGQSQNYRKATPSDYNVNFVSISFKVTNAANYVFDADPTIAFDGVAVSNNLVRVALGVSNSFKIFGKTAASESVVNTEGGGTANTTVNAFGSYLSGCKEPALTVGSADSIVTLRIWIQDPTRNSYSTYSGKKLTISGLKLVPTYKVDAKLSVNNNLSTDTTIGKVETGSSATQNAAASASAYVKHGDSATFTATHVNETNYAFAGWAASASGSIISGATGKTYTVNNVVGNATYYAVFKQKLTITAKAVLGTGTTANSTYGTVQVGSNTSGATSTGTYNYNTANNITLSATAKPGYTFIGWFKNANTAADSSANSTSTSYDVSATATATYYARFRKNPTITLKAVLGTQTTASNVGNVYATCGSTTSTSGNTSTITVPYGSNVSLYATELASNQYGFISWYGPNSATTYLGNTKSGQTLSNVTADATYYARFQENTKTTIYFYERGYEHMKVYVYGHTTEKKYTGDWPGTELSIDKATGLYKIEFYSGENEKFGVIVSDNGSNSKRNEFTQKTLGGTYLVGAGSNWTDNFSLGNYRYVYYTNNNSWSGNLYCYAWQNSNTSNKNHDWPGLQMTKTGTNNYSQDIYCYQMPTNLSYDRMIFNNNNNNQTNDITMSNSECRYYGSGSTW